MADADIGTLIEHCLNDRIDYALFFIEAGLYDINETTHNHLNCIDGCNALHISTYRGQQTIVDKLVTIQELDLNLRNSKGLTALHIAILNNNPEIAKILILNGSSTTIKTTLKSNNIEKNSSPLLLACLNKLNEKWFEVIKLLIENTEDIELNQYNESGLSPIYACIDKIDIDDSTKNVFDYLLNLGFKADIIFQKSGFNALDKAENMDNDYIIDKLNTIPDYKRNYITVILNYLNKYFLDTTTDEQKENIYQKVKNILEKNEVNLNSPFTCSKWNDGDTLLHYVCYKGELNFIKLFVEHNSNINAINELNLTPLMYVIININNNDESIEYFANLEGVDYNIKTIKKYKYYPIDCDAITMALEHGSIKFIEIYQKKYDIDFNTVNSDGETYLMKAIRREKTNYAKFLLTQEQNFKQKILQSHKKSFRMNYDYKLNIGDSVLTYLIYSKNELIIDSIIKIINKFDYDYNLFKLALNFELPKLANAITPIKFPKKITEEELNDIFTLICKNEYNDVFDTLYEKKIIPYSVLSCAIINGNDYIATKLFDDDFDPNTQFTYETDTIKSGSTLLHYTIVMDMENMFNKLLENPKINLEIKNSMKQTPLYVAFEFGRLEMIEKLIQSGANVNITMTDNKVNNQTVLMKMAYYGMNDMVCSMLKTNTININSKDDFGRTALVYAILRNHENLAIELIKKKALLNIKFKNSLKGKKLSLPVLIVKKGLTSLLDYITKNNLLKLEFDNITNFLKNISEPMIGCSISLCTYCMENDKSIVFLPCGHCVSCEECYKLSKDKITQCPICRKQIDSTIKIYL